jgi:hypothetical protein
MFDWSKAWIISGLFIFYLMICSVVKIMITIFSKNTDGIVIALV